MCGPLEDCVDNLHGFQQRSWMLGQAKSSARLVELLIKKLCLLARLMSFPQTAMSSAVEVLYDSCGAHGPVVSSPQLLGIELSSQANASLQLGLVHG